MKSKANQNKLQNLKRFGKYGMTISIAFVTILLSEKIFIDQITKAKYYRNNLRMNFQIALWNFDISLFD
jgi:nucleoid-associated protein YejK